MLIPSCIFRLDQKWSRVDQIWSNLEFKVGPLLVQGGPDLVQGGPLLVQGGPLLVQPRVSSTVFVGLHQSNFDYVKLYSSLISQIVVFFIDHIVNVKHITQY